MTKKHEVLKVLGEPIKATMNLGDKEIEYWEVKVLLSCGDFVYESLATFMTEEHAKNLKAGKVFNR